MNKEKQVFEELKEKEICDENRCYRFNVCG